MQVLTHGSGTPEVIVLHGGPGAPGGGGELARRIAEAHCVLEPWQRPSGRERLSVALHVADLHALVRERCTGVRPALVGESWGAMLALAFAAAHPSDAGPLALIGCGTVDAESRARMERTLAERTDNALRARLERVRAEVADPGERLKRTYELMRPLYDYDAEDDPTDPECPALDEIAHTQTWSDMLRQQESGVYPAAFAAIRSPVIMLHGEHDPHPGAMIHRQLKRFLPQIEYEEWPRCGHSPWRERQVRDEFIGFLKRWLARSLRAQRLVAD